MNLKKRAVIFDTGPLGQVTNPSDAPSIKAAVQWYEKLIAAGCRVYVPAIADYEVRRELIRARKTAGIAGLNEFVAEETDRYLPLTDAALKRAAEMWAATRNAGQPTADARELDCDVIIAAQALELAEALGLSEADYVVATVNVIHLARFVPAEAWGQIRP